MSLCSGIKHQWRNTQLTACEAVRSPWKRISGRYAIDVTHSTHRLDPIEISHVSQARLKVLMLYISAKIVYYYFKALLTLILVTYFKYNNIKALSLYIKDIF